jgi:hypothetical protein
MLGAAEEWRIVVDDNDPRLLRAAIPPGSH